MLFGLVTSCNDFYKGSTDGDLSRIPLIEPYELIKIKGFEEIDLPTKSWFLNFYYAGDTTIHKGSRQKPVDEINVEKGVIYSHCFKFSRDKESYAAIIPSEKAETVFSSKEQWEDYLKSKGIAKPKLYVVGEIWTTFKKEGTTPWYDPANGIYPVKRN